MAQLVSASFGETSLSMERWQMARELERLRKERLKWNCESFSLVIVTGGWLLEKKDKEINLVLSLYGVGCLLILYCVLVV